MRRIIATAGIIIFAVFLYISTQFLHAKIVLDRSITHNHGEYVVLLHGLGRTTYSMHTVGLELAKKGYRVINLAYPTRSNTIEHLVEKHLKDELAEKYTDRDEKINFVTHSMGGIMVRYFLAHNELENVGRVVMLAPPNNGSEAADRWSHTIFMSAIMGPALKELTTEEDSFVHKLPIPYYDVGIIAGEYDEKISVDRTKLAGMKDFLIVPREHTFIMNDRRVITSVVHFLYTGNF